MTEQVSLTVMNTHDNLVFYQLAATILIFSWDAPLQMRPARPHRYKYLMQFMCDNVPEAAEEIRVVYIESMGRTISALFRAYHAQLMKLELEMTTRHDLIAVEVREQDC